MYWNVKVICIRLDWYVFAASILLVSILDIVLDCECDVHKIGFALCFFVDCIGIPI